MRNVHGLNQSSSNDGNLILHILNTYVLRYDYIGNPFCTFADIMEIGMGHNLTSRRLYVFEPLCNG